MGVTQKSQKNKTKQKTPKNEQVWTGQHWSRGDSNGRQAHRPWSNLATCTWGLGPFPSLRAPSSTYFLSTNHETLCAQINAQDALSGRSQSPGKEGTAQMVCERVAARRVLWTFSWLYRWSHASREGRYSSDTVWMMTKVKGSDTHGWPLYDRVRGLGQSIRGQYRDWRLSPRAYWESHTAQFRKASGVGPGACIPPTVSIRSRSLKTARSERQSGEQGGAQKERDRLVSKNTCTGDHTHTHIMLH